jgi:hypothetical protein
VLLSRTRNREPQDQPLSVRPVDHDRTRIVRLEEPLRIGERRDVLTAYGNSGANRSFTMSSSTMTTRREAASITERPANLRLLPRVSRDQPQHPHLRPAGFLRQVRLHIPAASAAATYLRTVFATAPGCPQSRSSTGPHASA